MEDLEDALDMLTFHLSIIKSSAMIKKEMLSMFNQLNLSMLDGALSAHKIWDLLGLSEFINSELS